MSEHIAVLAGGLSLEREVSLRSGGRISDALDSLGYRVELLDLDATLVSALMEGSFDVVVLALHGRAGEDGTVQGLLELLGIPYTGPDATASALAWDKAICKGVLARGGIPTPAWSTVALDVIRDLGGASVLPRLADRLGVPLVIKPAQGGAFMGVRFVDEADRLSDALMAAFSYHDVVLAERLVRGTEVAVTVLDGEPLPAVEIVPKGQRYDFAARYTHGATDFYAPARLSDAVRKRAEDVVMQAWEATGCRHIARADLIIDAEGEPWVLELDTCPGMTETSLVPMAAEAAGLSFPKLCERIVSIARRA